MSLFCSFAAMEQMGECMVEDGRQEMALPFLEKALCIKKERLPGDHIGLAEGEI